MIEVISIVGCSVSIVCLLITLSAHMVVWRYVDFALSFLAHLSRSLIGELIVYEGIRRPSVRPSSVVCQHFQTTTPLKP